MRADTLEVYFFCSSYLRNIIVSVVRASYCRSNVVNVCMSLVRLASVIVSVHMYTYTYVHVTYQCCSRHKTTQSADKYSDLQNMWWPSDCLNHHFIYFVSLSLRKVGGRLEYLTES